ncbi:ATP-binding protein [Streptomonospora sp. S1-112]|uniref:ATP-binding protein n=1 Tax=Streptomonospora mangrovi TaxID=2883123 RepID=A0A9X3NMB0_9ACTN|nr:ATP-binding protein [Streptomonospora mangrovi]
MDVTFSIALPREAYTVAVMRDFLGEALRSSGICAECRFAILLAASEACANVVDHGFPAVGYQVDARLLPDTCVLEITHRGRRFNPSRVPLPDLEAESGRGILLMRHLMEDVAISGEPDGTTRVLLRKRLAECAAAPPDHGECVAPQPVLH